MYEVGSACEQYASTIFDKGEADGRREMRFSPAWWPEQDEIGAFFQPAIAGTHRGDLSARDHRHGIEGEAFECLARWQACFAQMPLDAAAVTFGHFMFGEGSEQPGGGPAFLVGALGEF